jgi:hypothetical protein
MNKIQSDSHFWIKSKPFTKVNTSSEKSYKIFKRGLELEKWYLIEHIIGSHNGSKITQPILCKWVSLHAIDQASCYSFIIPWRSFHFFTYPNADALEFSEPWCVNNPPKLYPIIEWNDWINVLGEWDKKPNWKELLPAFRKSTYYN